MGVSSSRDKTRGPGKPVAVKIKLGWVLSGPLKLERKSFNSHEDSNGNFLPQVRNAKCRRECQQAMGFRYHRY